MDYRLLVEFTAEQRDHLDKQRAMGMPASTYIRSLVNREIFKGTPSPEKAPPSVSEPMAFTDAAAPAQTSDIPGPTETPENSPNMCDGCGGRLPRHRTWCLRHLNTRDIPGRTEV